MRQPQVQSVFVKCIFGGGRGRLQRGGVSSGAQAAAAAAGTMHESQSFVSRLSAAADAADPGYFCTPISQNFHSCESSLF